MDVPSQSFGDLVIESSRGGISNVDKDITEQRRRRVVIVGIPGVGKSTVVTRIAELMSESKLKLEVVNYGSVMLEEASKRHGVRSRDDMRKLPVEVQRELQVNAAASISKMRDEYTLIDTHLFIATREGFWPGMPMDVIKALKPTHLILVSASVEEIKKRRENDPTRARDHATIDSLNNELDVARHLLFSSSLVCGCPALVITNSDGQVDLAAQNVIKAVFRS